jgi:hypothetical protein
VQNCDRRCHAWCYLMFHSPQPFVSEFWKQWDIHLCAEYSCLPFTVVVWTRHATRWSIFASCIYTHCCYWCCQCLQSTQWKWKQRITCHSNRECEKHCDASRCRGMRAITESGRRESPSCVSFSLYCFANSR